MRTITVVKTTLVMMLIQKNPNCTKFLSISVLVDQSGTTAQVKMDVL